MSGPAIAARQATAADARAIAEVHVEGWRWAYRGVLPDELLDGLSVERREAMWRDALAPPNAEARVWLAERDGRAIGFAATAPARGDGSSLLTAEVTAISVARHAAGTGAGRELLLCATGDLRRRGFRYAQLCTSYAMRWPSRVPRPWCRSVRRAWCCARGRTRTSRRLRRSMPIRA